ncbi:MAG: phosphatidylinositol kinase [Candidatus Angelobacter sp. Gp1-AA117]|nr:MAG: phosphatidylinositol kinase [Candidatus Angelobacter sp. Gp1-AA117]
MNSVQTISAVQHIRRMRGGSQSHLLRASDNNFYITKFKNNPQHLRVLASEYMGTRIGTLLGLSMPEVRVIDVSDWLITHSPELRIEDAGNSLPCAAGLQLASRYVADPWQDHVFDYLPEVLFERVSNREDLTRVLAFDKWTGNSDGRQAVFVKRPKERFYRMTLIDQGHCFNMAEWSFPDLALLGIYYRDYAYKGVTGWKNFEPVLSRIEQIDIADLWKIAAEVPEEWYQGDTEGLSRLIETLYRRRSSVRDLITNFRTSSRNPFPNWTD